MQQVGTRRGARARDEADAPVVPLPIRLALLLPFAAAALLLAAFIAGEAAGYSPLSYEPPRNMAEAAGMALRYEVLRYLREGEDPDAVVPVRSDIISSEVTRVTALEAAVWSRRVELVRLLEREGALPPEGPVRRHLACLARHLATADILAQLAPGGLDGCDPDATIAAIKARSQ